MATTEELKKICSQVRRDIVRMVHAVQSGHPGGSLGCTEFFVAMYFEILKHNPKKFLMDGTGEDLFFLSNGHISPVWYSVLSRSGYFDVKELATFRKLNSRLQGHPATHEKLEGVRVASGSLGQGLSVAIGAALTKKLNGEMPMIHDENDKENIMGILSDKNLKNKKTPDKKTFVYSLHGDGELQEGQIWEAAMFAAAKKVDNLISTIDYNGQQIDGATDDVLPMFSLRAKFESFGWDVLEMDGGNIEEVISTIKTAQHHTGKGKPVVILMRTAMGNGVDFMMGSHKWHGIAPNDEQLALALGQLEETLGDY